MKLFQFYNNTSTVWIGLKRDGLKWKRIQGGHLLNHASNWSPDEPSGITGKDCVIASASDGY